MIMRRYLCCFSKIGPVNGDCSCGTGPLVTRINELSCPSRPRRQPGTTLTAATHMRRGWSRTASSTQSRAATTSSPFPPPSLGAAHRTGRLASLGPAPTSMASHCSSACVDVNANVVSLGSEAAGVCGDGCACGPSCGNMPTYVRHMQKGWGASRRRGPRPRAVCVRVRFCGRRSSTPAACFSSGMKTREGVGARVEWPREVVDSCYERADVTRASVNDHLSYLEKPRKYAVCEARKCYVKVCGQHKKIFFG
jgi:hypothetical protein